MCAKLGRNFGLRILGNLNIILGNIYWINAIDNQTKAQDERRRRRHHAKSKKKKHFSSKHMPSK